MNIYRYNFIHFLLKITLSFALWNTSNSYFLKAHTYTYAPAQKLYPSLLTAQMQVLLPLSGEWHDENHQKWQVPFLTDEKEELILYKDFFLSTIPQDTIYLYFEGIAWNGEIYLNNRLLLLHYHPFEELLVSLPSHLLNKQWNQIKIKLSLRGTHYRWYPKKMLGIHKNVFLLTKTKNFTQRFWFPKVIQTDTTLFYAPFSYASAYNVGESSFRQDMLNIKNRGFKAVYFPFKPSYRLLEIVAELDIALAEKPGKIIAFYNTYPNKIGKHYLGWYDAGVLNPSQDNQYHSLLQYSEQNMQAHSYDLGIIILLLLLLAIWKVLDTPSFNRLVMYQNSGARNNSETSTYRQWLLSYTLVIRIIASSCFLYFSYNLNHLLEYPFFELFQPQEDTFISSIAIFFRISLLLGIYNVLKYTILGISGMIYKYSNLGIKLLSIEARASFPTNLLLVALVFVFWISPPGYPLVTLTSLGILIGIHIFRKYYFIYTGLNNTLRIPVAIIFLYICAIEFMPWFIIL